MNKQELIKQGNEIIARIKEKWSKLVKNYYISYSVKELAYIIATEITQANNKNRQVGIIFCKTIKDKFKIAIELEKDIYFIFDIWWKNTTSEDCGLYCGNGNIQYKLKQGYKDIEIILEN